PIVLGHSFGGRVIIKSVTGENPTMNPPKIILTDSAGIKPRQSLKSKINTRMYKIGRAFMSTALMKKLFPNAVENMRNKRGSADYRAASPIMRQTLVKVVNEDLTHLLSDIKQSTLLIWGDKDDATPLSDGQLMEKLISDSGLVVINGAGHYAFLEGWYTFSRVLASFLNLNQ
ncbi:MAG: alpha/beta hydrolase, partial [Ruminiclostridium sp.]|nr:alpha/beta hydrolase [Ruminiclostridium sp.]